MEDYVVKGGKKLRRGFTTGTCAAAAAQAAAGAALGLVAVEGPPGSGGSAGADGLIGCDGEPQILGVVTARIVTPSGTELFLPAEVVEWEPKRREAGQAEAAPPGAAPQENVNSRQVTVKQANGDSRQAAVGQANGDRRQAAVGQANGDRRQAAVGQANGDRRQAAVGQGGRATCRVRKDSGDDPDVTDGVLVYAAVCLNDDEEGRIQVDGGLGVGRVTKPGLACAVGEAAINPIPLRMIREEIRRRIWEAGWEGGASVEISIPEGVSLARRTYNPRLGIEGGISVLGTSGIVEPMSEQALIDTIKVEMDMRKAQGAEYLLITPGNYGEAFLKEAMGLGRIYTVKCSNFLGETLDYAAELGFRGVLLTAHIGKLVKVAGGMMNTHSKYGDARMEVIAAHGARRGADRNTVERLFSCVTTDQAIAVLDDAGGSLRQEAIESILDKVDYYMKERVGGRLRTGAVMFSNRYGYLGKTQESDRLLEALSQQK